MDTATQPRRLLGRLLVEMDLISEDQLDDALAMQRARGDLLGEVLIAQGYATRLAIQDALAAQRGLLLEPDTGFGAGLRGALVRREGRSERSHESDRHALLEETGLGAPATSPLRAQEPSDLAFELKRLAAALVRCEQRLEAVEVQLARSRLSVTDAPPDAADSRWTAEADLFPATIGRARKHLSARRSALPQP